MGLFFVYILKSSVCLAMFYLFYRLLLSRETFHRFNRIALLGILLLSCLLPLLEVSIKQQTEVQQTMMTLEQWLLSANGDMATADIQAQGESMTWLQVALLLYLAGVLFLMFRDAYSLLRLCRLLKVSRREPLGKYITARKNIILIVHDREIAPFSWMKYIVISRKDLDENGREILIHETAHVRNRHSWDLLVADVCIFFQWFNPAAWLLKQELQNIHEYEADETVIREGVDARQYQLLLIKKAVGTRHYSMANSFNHSKLKKRITMMLKEKSSPWARLRYLYVLPVAAIAVTAFARPEVSEKIEEISAVKVNDLAAIVETKVTESVKDALEMPVAKALPGDTARNGVKASVQSDDQIYRVVDEMPEFPGGIKALMKYIEENLHYPEAAKKAGKQGRVTVQCVIDAEGNVVNPRIVRSMDKELDAEAIRVFESMPKWNPGRQKGKAVAVKYTIPVIFSLPDAKSKTSVVETKTWNDEDAPLCIVNGKEVDSAVMSALSPEKIEKVSVLKDQAALEKYGDKGKNGVLLVTLKK